MKKNRAGFMLAEAIITSVVVATAMIGLYATINKLFASYQKNNNYYNVDAVYATKSTINSLLKDDFNLFINNIIENNSYKTIIDDKTCFYNNNIYTDGLEEYNNAEVCKGIQNTYKVNKMIIADYDKSVLEEDILKDASLNLNETFKEYIKYVIGYYEVSNNDTRYSYIILTEIKDGNKYYYANLGIE